MGIPKKVKRTETKPTKTKQKKEESKADLTLCGSAMGSCFFQSCPERSWPFSL